MTPTADGGAQEGIGLVIRDRMEVWDIDSTQFHGPNVVSCEIILGIEHKPPISAYLPSTTLEHLPELEETLNCFPGRYPIALGELNVNVDWMGNP